ncbi:deleted in malignant brain tumors 1 -like protein [Labeo rohita]|uniref:Deleted in malignant brain tumors 1-like protein n=1 Tax=Labeo rohita TaxID=84645 RepID=A0A498N4K3_LABRO|nr:deleted in malignant brain tumors 1 -like protein [Labeo rohita]
MWWHYDRLDGLEKCCDYIRVYDGPTTLYPLLGEIRDYENKQYNSSNNDLTVLFYSDGSVSRRGFHANWFFVDSNSCKNNCGFSLGTCSCDDSCRDNKNCCYDYNHFPSCMYNCGHDFGSCSCAYDCHHYGICCSDYDTPSCMYNCGHDFGICSCAYDCQYYDSCCKDYDIDEGSCQNYCGEMLPICGCDDLCQQYLDCCPDYENYCLSTTTPVTVQAPSCMYYCGYDFGSCSCAYDCQYYGNCCPDYNIDVASCQNYCGEMLPICGCDDLCQQYGDCCPDYENYCSSTTTPVMETTEFDIPWRDNTLGKEKKDALIKGIKKIQPYKNDLKCLRILVAGPCGSGKSSFINSVNNALEGRITSTAQTDRIGGGTSFTVEYTSFKIETRNSSLRVVFNDIMGLEAESGKGCPVEDVIKAIYGHIRPGHVFNPEKPLSSEDANYIEDPMISDQAFCLVYILPANRIQFAYEGVLQKKRDIRMQVRPLARTSQASCGGTMTDWMGEFFSPQYPNQYPNDARCTWTMHSTGATTVLLSFTDVFLEECCDYIRVYDGPTTLYPLLGEIRDYENKQYNSSNNDLTVLFYSDGSVSRRGFHANWFFVDSNSCKNNCGFSLGTCSCDDSCRDNKNCCYDYNHLPSCMYNCGHDFGICSCAYDCQYYYSCCEDYDNDNDNDNNRTNNYIWYNRYCKLAGLT